MSLPGMTGSGGDGGVTTTDIGDNVAYSLMLNRATLDYLSRTVTTSATATYVLGFKRGILGAVCPLIDSSIKFNANDTLTAFGLTTTAVFRDPSAHYLIHVSNGGLYVNGIYYGAVTTSALTNPRIGFDGTAYADGYMTMCYIVDGTSDAYSNYGRTSADTGQWVYKSASPTYGAKGHKLNFSNSAALGTDSSGNGNNWTLNGGISSANQYADTPTNTYCVMNFVDVAEVPASHGTFFSRGNLAWLSVATLKGGRGTMAFPTTGKWVFEYLNIASTTGASVCGITTQTGNWNAGTGVYIMYVRSGVKDVNGTQTAYGTAWADGATVGGVYDADLQTVTFYLNGVSQGALSTASMTGPLFPTTQVQSSSTSYYGTTLFGATALAYAGSYPATAKTLCTANLPTPAIIKSTTGCVSRYEAGSGIAANLATDRAAFTNWLEMWKRTDGTGNWQWRFSDDSSNMMSFNDKSGGKVAWSAPAANTWFGMALQLGTTYGINSGTYTSDNTANRSIAHGLGVAPKMLIVTNESTGSVYIWHTNMTGTTYFTIMNSATPPAQSATNTPWGTGTVDSTNFMVTNNATNNLNPAGAVVHRWIAFADVEGFLDTLTHTGNASADGTSAFSMQKHQALIEKNLAAATSFFLFSDVVSTYNPAGYLEMNTTAALVTTATVDLNSNGVKHRATSVGNAANAYMDLGIARSPLKFATAR